MLYIDTPNPHSEWLRILYKRSSDFVKRKKYQQQNLRIIKWKTVGTQKKKETISEAFREKKEKKIFAQKYIL